MAHYEHKYVRYWIPWRKAHLVDQLVHFFGESERAKFQKMKVPQLKAILHRKYKEIIDAEWDEMREEYESGQGVSGPDIDEYPWLALDEIAEWEDVADALGVSEVARGRSGFLPQYKRAGGDPSMLSEKWIRKRNGFVARHMAQMEDEDWYEEDGIPTRRHLALIMWAYSPELEQA